ncbi:MAG: hypothetical protein ACM3MH_07280, partial [Actinomycetota bacterium]
RARKPEPIRIGDVSDWGYRIALENLPISTENVFTNYDESNPARIDFALSDGSELELVFPEVGVCFLICNPKGRQFVRPRISRAAFQPLLALCQFWDRWSTMSNCINPKLRAWRY